MNRFRTESFESAGSLILFLVVVLSPLAFWPSPYIALDIVKVSIIVLGILISAILYGIVALKEKKIILPPKGILVSSLLVIVSLVVSAALSGSFSASFFGQGMETGTAGFIITLFLAALVSYSAVRRHTERAIVLYTGISAAFLIVFVFQVLRLIFGNGFASLGILNGQTATIFGNWYSFGFYSTLIALIALLAVIFLPLSRRMKVMYWIIVACGAIGAFIVNNVRAWEALAVVSVGLAVYLFFTSSKAAVETDSSGSLKNLKRLAWIPLIVALIAVALVWKGQTIAGSVVEKLNVPYTELSLPWQMTLDVASGAVKDSPLVGVGPNRFMEAFLMHKPAGINPTDAWGVEFNSGFGFIPTFLATQGLIGGLLWLLFLVFFGIFGARLLSRLPSEPSARFIVVSSYAAAVFLWLSCLIYTPSHVILLYTFILTGISVGAAVAYGAAAPVSMESVPGSPSKKFLFPLLIALILLGAVGVILYGKKITAFAYFASGVKALNVSNDPVSADVSFAKALGLDPTPLYWRARVEAHISAVNSLVSALSNSPNASTSQAVATQASAIVNQGLSYSLAAIASDPADYYNYVSEARISTLAASLKMTGAYDNAVKAYEDAITRNPANPSLYLGLARLQASENHLDLALKTTGAALQVKNNYLDGVFLLSQIEAAQGNLPDAITAAKVATQINPQNPLVFFQLGLLYYTSQDYVNAVPALESAIKLAPDYANAKYFLGLAYARLGRTTEAITQFQDLSRTNPDNQEVALILRNLQAGKSPFTDAVPPVTPNPEKRATLPVPDKQPN